ncbi:MAG: UvrD-helicase domain-containing protein [Clostridia bacterium]|nr:UvrD-helicase domain-containing protein [Clostridia bacterium]
MGWNSKVGIAKSFKSDMDGLSVERQNALKKAMYTFMRDKKTRSLDFEQVQGSKGLGSIRSTLGDRAVLKPYEREGVYLFLTAGDHDKTRERAKRKQVDVNPYTGAVQIFELPEEIFEGTGPDSEGPETCSEDTDYIQYTGIPGSKPKRNAAPAERKMLFEGLSDDSLLHIGVPEQLLDFVRGLDESKFQTAADNLPEDTYEYLALLADGCPLEEVLAEARENSMDVKGDIGVSLSSPAFKDAFIVVDNESELSEALDKSWEDWMTFLHPSQRRIAEAGYRGPAMVLGAAGTGKTVIAMHRAKYLASTCNPDEHVLFTTFTKNLTADISRNLSRICTREEYLRIDVINLDDWVSAYMKDNGILYSVIYGKPLDNMWDEAAAGSPLGFKGMVFKNEWETVVMPQRILSYEMYARADRSKCGRKLDAAQRRQTWDVFDRYISLMKKRRICDNDYAMLQCEDYISKKYGAKPMYRHIIIDEAQDFGDCAYRLFRAMAGKEHRNDIYITGDSRQNIYGRQAMLSRCGINVAGKSELLKINYRTTEEIKEKATAMVADIAFSDMDRGRLRNDDSVSLTHGPVPVQHNFATYDEEVDFIVTEVQKLKAAGIDPWDICVAMRTVPLVKSYIKSFIKLGLKVLQIETDRPERQDRNTLRAATMHRIKGLEFKYVFLCSLNSDILPPKTYKSYYSRYLDDVTLNNMLVKDQCLLYMAMTRAQRGVYLTSYGTPSGLLPEQQDTESV